MDSGRPLLNLPRMLPLLLTVLWVRALSPVSGFPDWLVTDIKIPTTMSQTPDTVTLSNGLISRKFVIAPDFATVDYYSYEKQSSLLRAISPEAVISIDGLRYNVGGLKTSIPRAYLNRTALAADTELDDSAFHYVTHTVHEPEAPFPYTPRRGAPKDIVWPPKGLRLDVTFKAPFWAPYYHRLVTVVLHYEMYDGAPLMTKWITAEAEGPAQPEVDFRVLSVEYLAVNWQWAQGGYDWLYVQTDQAHNTVTRWETDPSVSRMPGSFERIVNCTYKQIPDLKLDEGFESFRVMELVVGSNDQERIGLAKRKMMRLLAPHTQENPIFFHMVHTDSQSVRAVIDQMADVGFEMLIFSFGAGFDYESQNDTYIEQLAADVAYAKSKNIEVGGYDLIALTRHVDREWMAVYKGNPSACFASGWYDYLLGRILNMMDRTGMTFIESDGPYSGYPCSSTNHSHHKGYSDSIYKQTLLQNKFYRILRTRGVYINQPDNYFYQGGSKTGMGYSEMQYSLPRWQDLSVSRQGMFDDTFHYIPTVGWMFLPLVDYHSGGAAAAFEPLHRHVPEYSWGLAQYLSYGVAACYRGYQLYDGETTRNVVLRWVEYYKTYRDIITSDIVHVRRADMQGLDCIMHVNPRMENKALAVVFNPTMEPQVMNLTLPLYYSGITMTALVSRDADPFFPYKLDRRYNIEVEVKMERLQVSMFLIHDHS